jgi:hypothetical protein
MLLTGVADAASSLPFFQARPATGATELQTPRWEALSAPLPNGEVLIAGGANATTFPQSAELFNPTSGTFTQLPASGNTQLQQARDGAIAAPLPGGKVLIAGGFLPGGNWLQSAEIFDSSNDTFTALPQSGATELQTPRYGAVAAPLPNGDVLIAGGQHNNTVVLQTAEVFDPITDTFTALPASGGTELRTARQEAATAVLPGGRVLIVGGVDGNGNVLASAEIFDPTTDTFTALPASGATQLQTPRDRPVAAPLPDGRVLIAGGRNSQNEQLQSAEIFDPSTDMFTGLPASGNSQLQVGRNGAIAAALPGGRILIAGGDTAGSFQSAEIVTDISPPSCAAQSARAPAEGAAVHVSLQCTGPAGFGLTYSIASAPAHGSLGPIDQNGAGITYTPAAGYAGQDSFTYVASNYAGSSTPVLVTITVPSTPAPPPPPIASLAAAKSAGLSAVLSILCQGAAGQTCTGEGALTVREHKHGSRILAVTARARHHHGTKIVTVAIGSAPYSVPAGQAQAVRLPLNKTGRQLLARFGRLSVKLALTGAITTTRIIALTSPRQHIHVLTPPDDWSFIAPPCTDCYTLATSVPLAGLPKGARVIVTCVGSGCPFHRRTLVRLRGRVNLASVLAESQLQPGTQVEVAITERNAVGEVLLYQVRKGSAPLRRILCLAPGASNPAPCM